MALEDIETLAKGAVGFYYKNTTVPGWVGNTVESIPVLGSAFTLGMTAIEVYNESNVVVASAKAVGGIARACLPPHFKYPIKCGVLGISIGCAIVTGGTSPFCYLAIANSATAILKKTSEDGLIKAAPKAVKAIRELAK